MICTHLLQSKWHRVVISSLQKVNLRQYCNLNFKTSDLTFDHVIPKSKGGLTCWENVVAACSKCNLKKSDLYTSKAKMTPIINPYEPTNSQLKVIGKTFPPNYLHKSWQDYIYWDTELEKS